MLQSSQQNPLAAAFVYATSRTLLARPSAIILTAKALPTVVLPQPGGPTTPAMSLLLARQFNTLSCSESREISILIVKKNRRSALHLQPIYEIYALVQVLFG